MSIKLSFSKSLSGDFNSGKYFSEEFLTEQASRLNKVLTSNEIGFYRLPEESRLLNEAKSAFDKFSSKKNFVLIGIGGSSLGPQMLIDALRPRTNKCQFTFINNIDPEQIADDLSDINIDDTLFYVVSKSGGTAETMASLAIVTDILNKEGVSADKFEQHFVFATDPQNGHLRELARENNITCLEIPPNIGGRFSVFTAVGIFPALFAGINVEELLQGAREVKKLIEQKPIVNNDFFRLASTLFKLKENMHVDQTVLMPYSSKLRGLSFWFVQLWAESLGKALNKKNELINDGFTPIPSYGATDQHSQVQLFMEGPKDKCFLVLEVEQFKSDFSLKNSYKKKSLERLSSHKLSDLMNAELKGTLQAFEQKERPYVHIKISQNNAKELGGLILLLETLTASMGEYMDIDAFNQPGVEAGKIFAYEHLDNA